MKSTTAAKILVKKGLSVTEIREKLIQLFLISKKPLSKTFIDEKAKEWADRVSVYRNLLTLCEKGILRKISSEEGGVYLLVNQKEKKQHMHFQCRHCHQVYCFTNIEISPNMLPVDFKVENIEFTATGLCNKCLKN
ncbi:MAG TPA: transcriptional repressor [Bacteroidales bacterium]|nr:transcriptional repressor [Bacteroidales bacterium]